MSTKARLCQGIGAMLVLVGAALTGVPAANAAEDPLPVPAPPHLISAVVTGCDAPCAIGKSGDVVLTWERSQPPNDEVGVDYREYADGFRLAETDWVGLSDDTITMAIPICASDWSKPYCYPAYVDALRGGEVMTVTAYSYIQNPDYTGRTSEESAPSNGLVSTQG